MKSLKKLVLLVASLVMAFSMMAISASATDTGSSNTAGAGLNAPKKFADADVTVSGNFTYNGKEQTANVTVKGLKEGTDYTVSGHKQTNSGTYEVTVTGIGDYKGTVVKKSFTIKPLAKTKATVKTGATQKTVKATSFKKKAKSATFTLKSKNKGKALSVKVTGGNKKTRKKIKVVRKGNKIKVTMPKGTKKGTYKIKVRVKAYNQYKKTAWKIFKVVVK